MNIHTTWMNLKNIKASKRGEMQETFTLVFQYLYKMFRKSESINKEENEWFPRVVVEDEN